MVMVCGIDEAGRGPILGPLVMAGILTDDNGVEELKRIKVRDSKLLTAEQREDLFGQIIRIVKDYKILIINPAEIDASVNSNDGMNLNWLEARKAAEILNFLNPDRAIVDCPSPNIAAYRAFLMNMVANKKMEAVVEHKADVNWAAVSAASILAKVTRDAEIEKLKAAVAEDFGSGYLHDPKTIAFFEKHFESFPDVFRKSWTPYKNKVFAKSQRKLGNY